MLKLRHPRRSDLPAMMRLEAQAVPGPGRMTEDDIVREIGEYSDRVAVLADGEEVLGYVMLRLGEADRAVVHRLRGASPELVGYARKWAARRARATELVAYVRESSTADLEAFKAMGWKSSLVPGLFAGEDGVRFAKKLAEKPAKSVDQC